MGSREAGVMNGGVCGVGSDKQWEVGTVGSREAGVMNGGVCGVGNDT